MVVLPAMSCGSQQQRLSSEQVRQFVVDGFVVIHNWADPAQLEAAREKVWSDANCGLATVPRLQRDVPATWRGPFTPEEIEAAEEDTRTESERGSGLIAMLGVQQFSMRLREIGACPELLSVLPQAAWPLAEQLVGNDQLVWPDGDLPREMIPVDYRGGPNGTAQPWARRQYEGRSNRGVYCTFPGQAIDNQEPSGAGMGSSEWRTWWKQTTAPRCHDDGYWGSSIRVGAVLLLEDCPPVGGAFGELPCVELDLLAKQPPLLGKPPPMRYHLRVSPYAHRCLARFPCASVGGVHRGTEREWQQVAAPSRHA